MGMAFGVSLTFAGFFPKFCLGFPRFPLGFPWVSAQKRGYPPKTIGERPKHPDGFLVLRPSGDFFRIFGYVWSHKGLGVHWGSKTYTRGPTAIFRF